MQTYSIGALLKFIVGIVIIAIVYSYVNVYEQPRIGIGFGLLGVFMIGRGISYFLFLGLYKITSHDNHTQVSLSYKLSLFFGIYLIINISLMINDKRSETLGLALVAFFLGLILLLGYSSPDSSKIMKQH